MKYHRYGSFRFSDYWSSWTVILVFLFFSVSGAALNFSTIFIIFPLFLILIRLGNIIIPHSERFYIQDNRITISFLKRKRTVAIPPNSVLVISLADIAPPFAVRTATNNSTHILKEKYAVSIIQDIQVDGVLKELHHFTIKQYTMTVIQNRFKAYQLVYSFVCTQDILDQLTQGKECSVVIPQSLYQKEIFDFRNMNVVVDDER